MHFWRLLVIAGILFFLVACGKAPEGVTDIPCEVVTANGLAALVGESKTPAEWDYAIAKATDGLIEHSTSQQAIGDRQQTNTYYTWKSGDADYTLIAVDGSLVAANVYFHNYQRQPALPSLLACLGQPDKYNILYNQMPDAWVPEYLIRLYFTEQGIVVWGSKRAPTMDTEADLSLLDQPLTADTGLTSITWLRPGNVSELDWQHSQPTGGTEGEKLAYFKLREAIYARVRPWPGAFEQADVTEIPAWMMPAPKSPLPTPATP